VTGWRIGYAVANPELSIEGARKFRNAHVPDLLDCPDAIPAYAHLIRSEGPQSITGAEPGLDARGLSG